MGCGKSSIGKRLAELLPCPIVDLDKYIEQAQARTIPEIFAQDGEPAFRQMELTALRQLITTSQATQSNEQSGMASQSTSPAPETFILSLGGGTLTTNECSDLVRDHTTCIYLRATVDTLVSTLDHDNGKRPMLNSALPLRARIEQLMSQRSLTYELTAHHIVDIDGKSDTLIAREIIRLLND